MLTLFCHALLLTAVFQEGDWLYWNEEADAFKVVASETPTGADTVTFETFNPSFPIDARYSTYTVIPLQEGLEGTPSSSLVTRGPSTRVLRKKNAYVKPPSVPDFAWEWIEPHLLPENHPIKKSLDAMFSKQRIVESEMHLLKAGFKLPKHKGTSNCFVVKHKKLPGYFLKLYTDQQPQTDWHAWLNRIEGAQFAREMVTKYQLEPWIKVPKKWIYVLPSTPASKGPHPKYLILVVEDMNILDPLENKALFADDKFMTPARLEALYRLIQGAGLDDSCYPFNVPVSKNDYRFSVIDTERHHLWPPPFYKLTKYLSVSGQIYWNHLIENGLPM